MKRQNSNSKRLIPTYRKSFTVVWFSVGMGNDDYDYDDDLPDTVKRCLDILNENVEVLASLGHDLYDKDEDDELTADLQLHDLYDMADDVSESSKLKRAESNFMKRQTRDLPP